MKLRKSLFWDTNTKNIDLKKNARYVIERVFDFGDDKEVRWLWKTYKKPQLKDALDRSRSLHPRTKTLWTLLLK